MLEQRWPACARLGTRKIRETLLLLLLPRDVERHDAHEPNGGGCGLVHPPALCTCDSKLVSSVGRIWEGLGCVRVRVEWRGGSLLVVWGLPKKRRLVWRKRRSTHRHSRRRSGDRVLHERSAQQLKMGAVFIVYIQRAAALSCQSSHCQKREPCPSFVGESDETPPSAEPLAAAFQPFLLDRGNCSRRHSCAMHTLFLVVPVGT